MTHGGALAVGLLVVACGSSPGTHEGPASDAGSTHDSGDGGSLACTGTDVECGGVCQPETVSACGPSCTRCSQPASSHGASDCFQNQCVFQCDGGYARCGKESCCGSETMGDVVQLAVGGETTCAILLGGSVSCWGSGAYGALCDGSVNDMSTAPQAAAQLVTNIVQIVLGDHHGCVLANNGAVECWGDDLQGQLGDGQRSPRGLPAPAGTSGTVTALAAGSQHTCALASTGGVSCWGDNTYGQLGVTGATSSSVVPVAVTGLSSGVTAIAAGRGSRAP